nr:hypothetical protein [Tanacetum cinerariifolium]
LEKRDTWDRDNITWGGRDEGVGLEKRDTWDRDNITWGGRDEGVGTVQVRWDAL